MSIIQINHITFQYPDGYENIFEDLTLTLDTDWKLGLIGRNGKGKTTFLKLLTGVYSYEGTIQSPIQFTYFPYTIEDPYALTLDIVEKIAPGIEQWRIIKECHLIHLSPDCLYQPFFTLSQGEQTKVQLISLFLNEDQFLLIDEPTNHLDYASRLITAKYLKTKKGFILVSHDRWFLDECIDHILSLNQATIDLQQGNFSSWWMNFERTQQHEETRNEHLKKEIRKLQQSAERTSHWSDQVEKSKNGTRNSGSKLDKGFVSHKAAKMMKRSKSLEARQTKAIQEKRELLQDTEVIEDLKIHPLSHPLHTLVTLENITIQYDGISICHPISFQIQQGQHLALDGINGTGKSSLMKLILQQDISHTGKINRASSLKISYVPQSADFLSGLLHTYCLEKDTDETLCKTILRKLGFSRDLFAQDMSSYSQGQKKKVLIAISLSTPAHLYIWDEPLNYLDIYARMQLEQLLENSTCTLLFCEHDVSFRQHVATSTITLNEYVSTDSH